MKVNQRQAQPEATPPPPERAPVPMDIGADEFAGAFPNAKVMVWERVRDKPDALIGIYEADGEVQNRVAEQVGGGEYVWRIKMQNGKWAAAVDGITGHGKFTISDRAFPKKSALAPAAAAAPQGGEPAMNMQQMLMAMMQQQTTLLTALISKPPPAAPDPIAMMTAFHQMMPPPPPQTSGLDAVNTAMDLMTKAQDLMPRGGGGGGSKMEDRLFSLAEAVAPTVIGRLMTPAPASKPAPAPAKIIPAPVPALIGAPLVAVEPPPPAMPEENPPVESDPVNLKQLAQFAMLSPYINKLVSLAEKQADPETYADVFLDEAEEKGLTPEQIQHFFGNVKLVAELSEKFPGVKKNAQWFEVFRACVVDMLTPNRETDTMTGDVTPPDDSPAATNSDA